ncbi:MAG: hypothetical protein ACK559_28775, partial [bacterium]
GILSIVSVVRFFASHSGVLPQPVSLIGSLSFLQFGVFISKVPMHGLTSLFAGPLLAPTPPPGMRFTFGGYTNEKMNRSHVQSVGVHTRVQREVEKEERLSKQ